MPWCASLMVLWVFLTRIEFCTVLRDLYIFPQFHISHSILVDCWKDLTRPSMALVRQKTLEAFCKSRALCPRAPPLFSYKSHILVAVVIMQISFNFTDIHYHLIHFHHLSVSHEQISAFWTLYEPVGIWWVVRRHSFIHSITDYRLCWKLRVTWREKSYRASLYRNYTHCQL